MRGQIISHARYGIRFVLAFAIVLHSVGFALEQPEEAMRCTGGRECTHNTEPDELTLEHIETVLLIYT